MTENDAAPAAPTGLATGARSGILVGVCRL